jgi:hypothetical protein
MEHHHPKTTEAKITSLHEKEAMTIKSDSNFRNEFIVNASGPISKAVPLSLPFKPTTFPSGKTYRIYFEGTYAQIGDVVTNSVIDVSLKYDGKTNAIADTQRFVFTGHTVSISCLFLLKATSSSHEAAFEVVLSFLSEDPAIAGTMTEMQLAILEICDNERG